LVPLPEQDQIFSHRAPKSNSTEKEGKKIIFKLLQVKTLGAGDYFGNFRGMIAYSNEDVAEPILEKERMR
jgi:hypothetical protein